MFLAAIPALASLAAASTAMTTAATVVSAGAAVMGGVAAKQSADYQAAVARNNALTARQMGEHDIMQGQVAAQEQDMKTKEQTGVAKAGLGASGFDMGSGSGMDIQSSQAGLGRLDALRQNDKGLMSDWRYKAQAQNFENEAEAQKAKGNNSLVAGFLNAGSTMLTGGSNFADKWMTYSRLGVA